MSIQLYGDWIKAKRRLTMMQKTFEKVISQFLHRETQEMRSHILEVFATEGSHGGAGWKPLSKFTLAFRRFRGFAGTTPLKYTGEMRKSITTKVESGKLIGFTGVLYQTTTADGARMVNIAQVNEFGSGPTAVRWTDKQRRLFFLVARQAGIPLGGGRGSPGVRMVMIPARPFMRPGAKMWQKGFHTRAHRFFKRAFGGVG